MVYTANSWWSQCVGTGEFGKTLLHLANYNYVPGPTPNGWKSYDIWQFSADGPFVGDSNFFPGSFNDLKALASNPQATNRSWHPATPAPASKSAVRSVSAMFLLTRLSTLKSSGLLHGKSPLVMVMVLSARIKAWNAAQWQPTSTGWLAPLP